MGLEETLRTARLEQKRSVEWVAGQIRVLPKMKVHANTIRYAESGKTSVGVKILQRWAEVLGYEVILSPLSLCKLPTTEVAEEVETPV